MDATTTKKNIFTAGDPQVWACGACASILLVMFAVLIFVVGYHGFRAFWVPDIATVVLENGTRLLGSISAEQKERIQLYTGNRDLNALDFRWVEKDDIQSRRYDSGIVVLERIEKGTFIGYPRKLEGIANRKKNNAIWNALLSELDQIREDMKGLQALQDQLSTINLEMGRIRLERLGHVDENPEKAAKLEALNAEKLKQFEAINSRLETYRARLRKRTVVMEDSQEREREIALVDVVRAYRPNDVNVFGKLKLYTAKIVELLTQHPRESNTEGGLFPAILGTVMMVMLMSLFCVPLGVVAAVYLREYAREGWIVNMVRIAVNNLAGVPSIVYGMFGLGFFVYGIGGGIDQIFYPERDPIPTLGTGGLLWASLTMALLTVPVVVVSTEEGLSAVPREIRDGSLALGATRFQTLTRVVLPMSSPGILTGLVLAITRAAGEVAPLMLVGVVKIAPSLPLDGQFPYLHLERKIMHLGFHIYDVGFQSPNVEAAKPMVYMTTLLLLLIVFGMSFVAMYLRNRMRRRYRAGTF